MKITESRLRSIIRDVIAEEHEHGHSEEREQMSPGEEVVSNLEQQKRDLEAFQARINHARESIRSYERGEGPMPSVMDVIRAGL